MSHPRLNDPLKNHASIDPNDPRPDNDYLSTAQSRDEGSGTMWGWIAGIAVLALIAAFMFGGSNNSQMANEGSGTVPGVTRSTQAPSGSTATAPSVTPSPNTAQTPPSTPAETTGSGSSSNQ